MSEMNPNNQNTELEPETQDSGNASNVSGENENSRQYYDGQQPNGYPQYDNSRQSYPEQSYANGQQYYNNGQQQYGNGQNTGYSNGQYYGQNSGQQYYNNNQNTGYNNQQHYGQNTGYNNGQYYGQNNNYNNGQYYGQSNSYSNGQYYGAGNGYNNGQYYGAGSGYNNGQYYGQNNTYNNGQYYGGPQYTNPQAAYRPAEPVREPVSNIFCYILMALTAISAIIGIIAARGLITNMFSSIDLNAMAGEDFMSMYSSMMNSFANAPGYSAYSVLNSLLGFAIIVISIIDIVHVHKKGYPILGMILFTIFCKPGYFIWRAYVLKQKKTVPVLYTVAYVLLYLIYFFWSFYFMLNLIA